MENEIQGGENENKKQSKFSSIFDTRLIALFVLGILIGVTVKTQASKTITMGYDDYRLENTKQEFDLTEARLQKQQNEEQTDPANNIEDGESTAGDEVETSIE